MKKILSILVLSLLLSGSAYADENYYGNLLDKKDGIENRVYNNYIKAYNKFKKEFYTEVELFCTNQVVGKGALVFIDRSKCRYRAAVDLLSKHNLNFDPMSNVTYVWHKNDFSSSKSGARAGNNCSKKTCYEKVARELAESYISNLSRYFKQLDLGVKNIATSENLKHLNKKDEVKISRIEAADNCAAKSKSKPSEIRSQFYKDCMQDLGY